nr:MAG TPA: hypothetical protein [Caudoviricetes sp.]DAF36406.1 MAG TPA: hypothetical protein [Bacteriophage sp.]DAG25761.1 MAG TPA: hypothetical protein [Bacteriophage sp.]DAN23290.1 MAG TPA_asm: hypothetical protein [Bacteriophage sp.]
MSSTFGSLLKFRSFHYPLLSLYCIGTPILELRLK